MAQHEVDLPSNHLSSYDHYGFAVYKQGSLLAEEDNRSHDYNINSADLSAKTRNYWAETLTNWEQSQLFSPKQLRQYIKHGVPDDMRGQVWKKLIGNQAMKVMSSFNYQDKLAQIRQLLVDLGVSEYGGVNCLSRLGHIIGSINDNNKEDMIIDSPDTIIMTRQWKKNLQKQITVFRQIMLDIDRSFPSHKMFIQGTSEGKEGRAALFRVLAVYAMYNPEVSYCQGMSYIAGMFLMNMNEEDSFWCLVSMFERPKYLAGYFSDSLDKIKKHTGVFRRLMRQRRPKLGKHLESLGVSPLMYLTPWFMALFTSLPNWDAVLIIWDLLLLDGISVIFRAGLALLDLLSDNVLSLNEMSQALPVLLRPPANLLRRDRFVSAIWRVKPIQKWEIDSLQGVLDEEKENQGKRRLSDASLTREGSRKKQRTMRLNPFKETQEVAAQPSVLKRFVGLFSFMDKPAVLFKSSDIEMTTFSVANDQSPSVPPLHFSPSERPFNSTRETPLERDNSRRPSRRRSGNHGKDALRRRRAAQWVVRENPLRRSPRLGGQQTTPERGYSPATLVQSSATNQHAFRLFSTPTPLRCSQVQVRPQASSLAPDSSPVSILSPGLTVMTPDVEMASLGLTDKTSPCVKNSMVEVS
ncbi:TBC1 domain family member 10B-like [Acropora muricata]|uniref:TBC1 domain family member 10B-like n=1 Tax=Acropora muricata TaxID=159855 RepID=UPI0034E48D40